jgi:aspartate/methionine/tyrosine aminotransferase
MFEFADKVRRLQQQGINVTDLSLGQPDVPAPDHISRALRESAEKPTTSYTSAAGSLELRNLISESYLHGDDIKTNPNNVVVTCGSKHALFISLLSLIDQGDEIVVPEPYFPPYAEIAGLIGARLKTVQIGEDERSFNLDVEKLLSAVSARTKVVLLNYPNNPAGWTLDGSQIKRIVEFCISKHIYLVSDEIYDKIAFDNRTHIHAWSYAQDSNYVVGLGSFSKTYSMVPYRLGFIIARKNVCSEILKSQRATITMVSPYVQAAGCAALKGPQNFVSERLRKYEERRDKCIEILRSHNIPAVSPEGAFYLFVKMSERTNATEFSKRFLERDNVAILPGEIFGPDWSRYVRLSFATPDALLYPAIEKFGESFKNSVGTD